MAKKKKAGEWIQRMKIGNATITVPGKTKKSARTNGIRFAKHYLPNVAMGFRDSSGVFHPIRASEDYTPYKAGEFPRRGKTAGERKAAQRRAKGRMETAKARRGRQSAS